MNSARMVSLHLILALAVVDSAYAAGMDVEVDGVTYSLTTGSFGGSCQRTDEGVECKHGEDVASLSFGHGCGLKTGQAACFVLADHLNAWNPRPSGSTLRCTDGLHYLLLAGRFSQCNASDGFSMICSGDDSLAEASCDDGCGRIEGNAACFIHRTDPAAEDPAPRPEPPGGDARDTADDGPSGAGTRRG